MLVCCSRESEITSARAQLDRFLNLAIHEFVHELGSTEKRWEHPFVTREVFLLTEMEFARGRAFSEGFYTDRTKTTQNASLSGVPTAPAPVPPKPPGSRSFWLPIAPEGTYTYTIEKAERLPKSLQFTVRFHMKNGSEIHSDQTARPTRWFSRIAFGELMMSTETTHLRVYATS